MSTAHWLALALSVSSCQQSPLSTTEIILTPSTTLTPRTFSSNSWQNFLQHLPGKQGTILDYTGTPIADQAKHVAILPYDVGQRDLQQCADALIRLRAEYLFAQKRFNEIQFRFTSGHLYTWKAYCNGIRPIVQGNRVAFIHGASVTPTYRSLRAYLDIVYAYAGTRSLASELLPARRFEAGTIILKPGSPGHCCIIIDEALTPAGKRVFKLLEGYTPAQSIYILKNPADGSPWYALEEGKPVLTASYHFKNYQLCRFE